MQSQLKPPSCVQIFFSKLLLKINHLVTEFWYLEVRLIVENNSLNFYSSPNLQNAITFLFFFMRVEETNRTQFSLDTYLFHHVSHTSIMIHIIRNLGTIISIFSKIVDTRFLSQIFFFCSCSLSYPIFDHCLS